MTNPGLRRLLLHVLLAGLFALASVAVPRLHAHAASHAPSAVVDLSAYAMPDGTLPELCLSSDGAGDDPPHCFACRLVAAPGVLPAAAGSDRPVAEWVVAPAPRADAPVRADAVWRPTAARAPPGLGPLT